MTENEKERGRQLLATVRQGMEVVDSDGTRIGTVARAWQRTRARRRRLRHRLLQSSAASADAKGQLPVHVVR